MDSTETTHLLSPEKQLSVRLLHSFSEAEPHRTAWNDLVARSGADVYQTFEWCSIWWKYYGTKRSLHLLFFYAGEDLVGIVPAFIETLWLGPVWIRAAKLVGADYSLTLCNLPVLPDFVKAVASQSVQYFVGKQRCDVLLFGPLAGSGAHIEDLQAAGLQNPTLVGETEAVGDTCNSIFALPDNFADYLKNLDKKQRSNFKRMIEQSAKAHRVSFDSVGAPETIATEFENFCREHEHQWRADGKLGHFGDWPHAHEFNRELIRAFGSQGKVRFYRILADEKVISSQYCFVHGRTVYWRLPARVRNAEWDRFSLGTMGLVKMIEAAIGEGLNTIEGGRGHYGYKVHHGAHEWPLRTVQFIRRGFGVRARVRLYKAFSSFLDFAYYKVLFVRLAPKIPALQHTLWSFWIRHTL
ncbi:MAG: GNAT family N-acetyltransferase [Nibricoccus sp.]